MCYVSIELLTHQHSNRATLNVVVYECGGYIGFHSGTRLIEMYTRQNPMHDSSHSLAQTHSHTHRSPQQCVRAYPTKCQKRSTNYFIHVKQKCTHSKLDLYTLLFFHSNSKRMQMKNDAFAFTTSRS